MSDFRALGTEGSFVEPTFLGTPADMAGIAVRRCEVHRQHEPRTIVNERHHVWPLGHGGPSIAANFAVICATGHNNVHVLLTYYLKYRGDVPWSLRRQFHPGERALAKLGYERITRGAL